MWGEDGMTGKFFSHFSEGDKKQGRLTFYSIFSEGKKYAGRYVISFNKTTSDSLKTISLCKKTYLLMSS